MIDSSETTKNCILKILENTHIPTVIDAGALFPEILNIKKKTLWVITPHDKEFERIFSCKATEKNLIKHGTENKIAIVKK
jgi:NAD(P)H-hydrate repair Nnr-like enzyme with NAD(P)H-hydrate dehydratase domain